MLERPQPSTVKGLAMLLVALVWSANAQAQDWQQVPLVQHSQLQAVNLNGSPAFAGTFPLRLRGIVLNDNEDWLDPAAAYDPGVHLWAMGGQAEIFVQAVSDPASPWYDPGDFGGTKAWMGQNYGNHIWHQDPAFSYSDAQWYAELDRLKLWRPGTSTSPLVRAGDLVEIRARIGLPYQGAYNVNESHDRTPDLDFEIVVLQAGQGLPAPAELTISDLKDAQDAFVFDSARGTGPERYQSTLVRLTDVHLTGAGAWAPGADLTLTDASGRTLPLKLGRDDSFLGAAPGGTFDVVGIINQADPAGLGGYYLLALDAGAVTAAPEPAGLLGLALGAAGLLGARRRR